MTSHFLPAPWENVKVKLPSNLSFEELMSYRPFIDWLGTMRQSIELQERDPQHTFHEPANRFSLRSIIVQSVDWFGKRIGFLKMETVVQNEKEEKLPGVVFMRGGSVAILMIIRPDYDEDQRLVIMTQQPRIPAGSLSFMEIPAGMIDDSGTFVGAAATEIKEETGLKVLEEELIDMTEKALANAQNPESHLKRAMYATPGGSDEYIALFLWERTLSRMQINEMESRLRGVDHEKIRVKLVEYEKLWQEGARDAKTLAACALYEALSREGKLHAPFD